MYKMEKLSCNLKEVEESVGILRSENEKLNDTINQISKEMKEIKKENAILRDLVKGLQTKEMFVSSPTGSSTTTEQTIGKMCLKLAQALKDEVGDGKEDAKNRLPTNVKVTNKTPPSTKASQGRRHPSRRALSRSEALQALERKREDAERAKANQTQCSFHVCLEEMQVLHNKNVCVEGYTRVEVHSDFMDPDLGLYEVPVDGKYRFEGRTSTCLDDVSIIGCRDRNGLDLSHDVGKGGPVFWPCKAGDLVWLESKGCNHDTVLRDVVFKGTKED